MATKAYVVNSTNSVYHLPDGKIVPAKSTTEITESYTKPAVVAWLSKSNIHVIQIQVPDAVPASHVVHTSGPTGHNTTTPTHPTGTTAIGFTATPPTATPPTAVGAITEPTSTPTEKVEAKPTTETETVKEPDSVKTVTPPKE